MALLRRVFSALNLVTGACLVAITSFGHRICIAWVAPRAVAPANKTRAGARIKPVQI